MDFDKAVEDFFELISPYLFVSQSIKVAVLFTLLINISTKRKQKNLYNNIDIPQPSVILDSKTDDFVIYFFKTNSILKEQYKKEIKENNIEILRKEFNLLYPLIILGDSFLKILFAREIKDRCFYKISKIYKKRRKDIIDSIDKVKKSPILENLNILLKDIVEAFSDEFYDKKKVRNYVFKKLEKFTDN